MFDFLVDKWRLGILRLIDAAVLGILLLHFGSPLAVRLFGYLRGDQDRGLRAAGCDHFGRLSSQSF